MLKAIELQSLLIPINVKGVVCRKCERITTLRLLLCKRFLRIVFVNTLVWMLVKKGFWRR